MGYKTLDVKADIHEDVEAYFQRYWPVLIHEKASLSPDFNLRDTILEDVLDIIDKNFEKIER